jgi:(p)ppGpp synthase/HD superfamily hydrolase
MSFKAIEKRAKDYAKKKHSGQYRRDGATPYITHPERVAKQVQAGLYRTVAWLHDVVEDTDATIQDIWEEFGWEIAEFVELLTHRKNEDYNTYLRKLTYSGVARTIKIVDIVDNLMDNPTENQVKKYIKALCVLAEK